MIKGPEFYVRFINYTFGDGFLLMAPTVILIMVIVVLMIAVYAATALFYHATQRKRAKGLMKSVKGEREDEIHRLRAESETQKKEIRRLQYEVNKWRRAVPVAQAFIRRADEIIHNPTSIKSKQEEEENG